MFLNIIVLLKKKKMAGMDNLVKWALVGGAVYLTYNYLKKRNSLPKFMKPSAGRAGTSLDSETIAGMEEMGEEGYAMKIAQEQQLGAAASDAASFSNVGGGKWVACPNPNYDCEGQCTSQFGSGAWDGNMGSTGSCNTGGAYWNPSPPTHKRSRFSGADGWDSSAVSSGM